MSGGGEAPTASILIPVRNEERWIRETAAAMRAQRFDGELEFLFIDGCSEDRTRAVLEELAAKDGRIRVLDNPAREIPQALNIALRAARGDWVARMDAHSWYPDDYVERGVERLRRGDVEWVTGPAVPRPTGRWARRVAIALGTKLGQGGSAKWSGGGSEGAAQVELELDTGVFAGVWPRATLERLGGWDEGWPVNEDAEMAGRVLSAGGRIVCLTAMSAQYAPRDSLRGLARQYARFGFYRVKTSRRHPVALRRSHLASAALALTAVGALLPLRVPARVSRAGLGAYGLALGALSVRAGREAGAARRDLAGLPVVLAVMHLGWGFGFLAGCARFGAPWAGVRRVLSP